MKGVLLDGHTINPGDLSWSPIEELLDEFTVYDNSSPEEILDRMAGCDVLMTSKCGITGDIMESAADLRYIGVTATGYNNVDIAAASERGIAVTNVPAYSTDAVAQHTVALLLELSNNVGLHSAEVHEGRWSECGHFCYWSKPVRLLSGMSLGIIGYGAIGRRVSEIAEALGMKVNIYSRDPEAVMNSDVISLHCPLTPENTRMVNEDFLAVMKPGSFLINTARGGLVDEHALAKAITGGHLAGAAMDVLTDEPPGDDCPLLGLDNCIITPHIAWVPREMRQKVIDILAANLKAWLAGERSNRVDCYSL